MSIPYQIVEASIGPGLDEKTHPSKVELGKLLRGENFVFNKNGTLSKRFGSNRLSNDKFVGVPLSNVETLASHKGEILALTNTSINSYSTTYSKWNNKDTVSECFGFDNKIIQSPFLATEPNISYSSLGHTDGKGVYVYVWQNDLLSIALGHTKHDIFALIVDAETGNVVLGPTQINTNAVPGSLPRVMCVGNIAIVTYKIDNTIRARNIDLTNPISWNPEVILVNDSVVFFPVLQEVYDAQPIAGNTTEFCFAYEQNVAAPRVRLHRFNATTLVSVATGLLTVTDTVLVALAIHATQDETFWIIYSANLPGPVTRVTGVNTATLAVTVPITTLEAASTSFFVGGCRTSIDRSAFTWTPGFIFVGAPRETKAVVINTAGVITATRNLCNSVAGSRPFIHNGKVYVFVYNGVSITWSILLCDTMLDSNISGLFFRPVCCLNPRQCDPSLLFLNRYICAGQNVALDSQGIYHTMSLLGINNPSLTISYQSHTSIDFNTVKKTYVELGGLTYFSGGIPSFFDSNIYAEIDFLHIPAIFGAVGVVTVGGSLFLTGSYSYRTTYIYIDASGNIHRGAPSIPFNITLVGAENSINLTLATLNPTTRQESTVPSSIVGIEIWRTQHNGTIYHRIHELSIPPELANRPDLFSILYTDVTSDSAIADNEILYTTGGVLDSVNPPSAQCIAVHKNRLYLGCNKTLWYSTTYIEGMAPRFNDGLTILLDEGGPITAIGSLDDKLVIYKQKQIYILYGDGPLITGAQSDYTDPQKISSNVGCIEPRSVVFSPIGLFFQSLNGIYLLSRSLDVTYIGQAIENELTQYPTIVSAKLHPTLTEVRFLCSNGSAGIELRFDYRVNQWSVCIYRDPIVGLPLNISSSMVNDTNYYWSTDGQVSLENKNTYLDNGAYVRMLLEFAPLSLQGTQGYQSVSQVLLNCERKSPHDMTVQLDIDSGVYAQTKTWANADLATLPKEQLEVHVGKVKNQSLVVRIIDAEPAVVVPSLETGEGYNMIGLTYRVGPNDGPQKLIEGARK